MRSQSNRFVHGTKPVLIKRAKIWTGTENGTEVIYGDILLDKGLIKSVGHLYGLHEIYGSDLVVVDAKDAMGHPRHHRHSFTFGRLSFSIFGRSLDGLNTHDESYPLSIAGGVTTALVLPGSTNAIGGQAFVIKLRSTKERENPRRFYKDTRMDVSWEFRQAYKTAYDLKMKQDEYCSMVLAGKWKGLGDFPQDLQWEALVDVIRGRVKVNAHCYEAVDLDALVRLSNEFKFPIAAIHHASEAYLVPDLLKKTYGGTPAVALFATNSSQPEWNNRRYKREAYRSSEFAPRILASHGITTLLKSDHPVSNSRYLLYEAQQAFYYGFPENLAIASVTSHAAEVMGIGHRVGYIKKGMDADLVIWDSHPLALGATPVQVFIDGIPQLQSPHVVRKPKAFQKSPKVPNFDKEAAKAVEYEGLPPLAPAKPLPSTTVFTNISSVYLPRDDSIEMTFSANSVSQIAALRRLLLNEHDGAVGFWFKKVVEGEIPLVAEAHSADIIATLIVLKKEVEAQTGRTLKLTITGATEAHILAKELGEARVGVILNPPRPFPYFWETRRILPGPPLTQDSAVVRLKEHGVPVGIGCEEIWSARNLPFDVAWAAMEAGGRISRSEALALGTVNVQRLLGVEVDAAKVDLVVTRGGDLLDLDSKVVAVVSPRGVSQLLE
ncbi:hypothetical protein C0992_006199 [Termitomyces sp. T32_za158]|nr:hypothetical protein C0992_006199 [Termitomyces sp. T32_za158]